MKKTLLFLFTFLSILFFPNLYGKEQTTIYLESSKDDKIGDNGTYVFDESNGAFYVKGIKPALSLKGFSIIFYHTQDPSWQFKFAIPANENLVKGRKYRKVKCYPYQSSDQAGMKVCGIHQDFNDLEGEFTLLDYQYENGEVVSLAIDFKQVAGKKGALNGSIRYHSSIPLTTDFEAPPPRPQRDVYDYVVEFFSEPGETIGQGKHYYFDKSFKPYDVLYTYHSIVIAFFDGRSWSAQFESPRGEKFKEGDVYWDATRCPYQVKNSPGLDFWGNGRAYNKLRGHFEILELTYDNIGNIASLAIDFVQRRDDLAEAPALRGTIRYNSNIPPSTEDEIKKSLD